MRTTFFNYFVSLCAVLISTAAAAAMPANIDGKALPSLAPLVERTSPAVVNIATKGTVTAQRNPLMDDPFFRRFFGVPPEGQREREVRSAGSGVIVDAANGYILTNHHVIENADEIEIMLDDDRSIQAEIVGSDPGTDIAVLKVTDPQNLVEMPMGDSEKMRVGDFVVAIGNPFGLQHTVTSGIVSALGRTGINREGYEDFIQTDASINPGNSGGALINLKGELIGINSAIFSGNGGNIGIGFAIPVNIARSIMDQILEYGEVKRGLLGVSISDFTADTAEAYGIDAAQGALVQEVVPGSAAENAGIEVGDVIIAVDDKKVNGASELRTSIGLRRSGEKVTLTVLRDGKEKTIRAELMELEAQAVVAAEEIHPGLAGAEFSNYDGSGSFDGKAVVVDSIAAGSPAAMAGLRPDDIVTSLNRTRVTTVKEMAAAAQNQNLLLLRIQRGNRTLLLQVR
ncbi:MAG: DegQ family serine endoprotease [Gammaproteobacteria bacterium]